MTDSAPGTSTIKRALAAIDRLQARVDQAERARTEPIAIVGLSCRFPGADSADEYWQLLSNGVDAISEVPADRWDIDRYYDANPDTPGKMYTRHGGFLRNVAGFDHWFFRVSPREARSLDPQHRLLLETAWEAFEDAAIAVDSLNGSPTGVFIGITTNDYARLLMDSGENVDAFFFTGNPVNAAAGRLAYTFGFQGPALAIDTACSSSLVSVHQACMSLRAGECRTALAGGVNLVLAPETTIAVCRTRALSAAGRCRTFDASADGFVRGEGCGLVVLKRLSDAIADGDRIRAVIHGSAVNQDGASSGFTVPNGPAQQAVIRRALGTLPPDAIDYLEAHGTGTPLGDPIEVSAAAAVYGEGRDAATPLYIGSAKTNIGHTEAAAGVAALIKTVLSLEHEQIPPHLHVQEPNPLIDWASLPVRIASTSIAWPRGERPRFAGISAFGASGTNAHAIISEAPATPERAQQPDRTRHLLVTSARTPAALQELLSRYRDRLASALDDELPDICHSAAAGRVHHRHRAAISGASIEELIKGLDAASSAIATAPAAGDEAPRTPRIAFLFTGQGSQYAGMGRTLYGTQPVFRDAIDRCAAILDSQLDLPLVELLFGDHGKLDDTRYTQPALFSIEYALASTLQNWGLQPAAVIGHSVGEFAAACIAGVFSLEDGLRLVCERARLMGALPAGGAMSAVAADEAAVRAALTGLEDEVTIAAVNAPKSLVISGRAAAVNTAVERLSGDGVRCAPLTVSHAFHSPLMEPALDAFENAASTVTFAAPSMPLISNLTGEVMTSAPDARYWRRHCRDAVQFARGVDALAQADCDLLIEIGPRPVLVRLAAQCRPDAKFTGLPALSPGEDDWRVLLDTLGVLYRRGINLDWTAFDRPYARTRVSLPAYPFQRQPHWISTRDELMNPQPTPSQAPPSAPVQRDAVLGVLRRYIAQLLQCPEDEINIHLPFLEMGADSLVMVDAIALVEKEFGLKLAIRRFFEDLSTIDALAEFVAASAPPPAAPPAPQASFTPAPQAAVGATAGTPLEQLLLEQTRMLSQFMAQSAEIMKLAAGGTAAAAPAPPPRKPAPVAAAPAAPAAANATAKPMMPWGNPAEIRARGLTPAQHQHLEDLIARYTARTRHSKARTQQYRSVLADSRATVGFRLSSKEMLYPIWGERSAGSRIWDIDGNEYIDFTMGFGVHLFGHKPDFIQQAVRDDLERAVELGARSYLLGEVASLFTELTGLDRVAFCNSGTEAVMAAVRLARAGTGRDKIVIFTNAYHGHSDTTLVRAEGAEGDSVPVAPGVPGALATDVIVLDYDSPASLNVLRRRAHEIAAVMVEPVQSRHLKIQPRAFLHELRAVTKEIGAALIFDEMITGFRAHLGGAQAYFDVKADIATYGKIVGGGLPIGLVAGSSTFMDGVDGGMWQYGDGSFPAADRTAFGGTFCQHPLSMAAARAVLQHMKAQGPALQQNLNTRTDNLVRTLNEYFTAEEVPIEATNFSSLFRFEFASNLDLLFYHMLERGIYIWEWRSCFLSTAHSDEDIQRFTDVVKDSVDALRKGGFAPRKKAITTGEPEISIAPLSEAQRQLWLLLEIDPTSSIAYNVNTTLELRGSLDAERLRTALQRVVDRHSALRTTIAAAGDQQMIHARTAVALPITDLSSTPETEREAALTRWREAAGRRPIDLVNGPTFRPELVRLAPDHHVLLLAAHHILADGMTLGVVLEDLAGFYNEPAKAAGTAPMQFRDYVAKCEARRGSPEMRAHETFWIEQFADGIPILDLPVDRPRPAVKTYAGSRVTTHIDAALLSGLKRLSREHGCTMNMTLLTAFTLMLHRYASQDDVVVGTSVTGRPFPGSFDMAGYCTHLVPVRSRLEGEPSFAAQLSTMKKRLLDVFDHQDLPFAELLHKLPVPRSAGAFPLISAVFNLEPVSTLPELHGLKADLLPQSVSFTPFDLFVNVTDTGATLIVDSDFNADLFDPATVQRMMNSFDALLRAAVASPASSVRELPLLSDADRQTLLVEWNDTARAYPDDALVHVMFEQQAAQQPDALALSFDGHDVSYASLNGDANRLARWLREQGVGPGVLVGICCERSVEMMTAVLSVLKAGGAYVPIDPEYPADRIAFMLKDAAPGVVLTQARFEGLLHGYRGHVLRLDADWYRIAPASGDDLPRNISTGDIAYMIYTSGSTGRPKGALNTHRGIANRLLWMQDEYALTTRDRILQKTPFSFDVSVWELLWPLMTGAAIVMAIPGGHRDPAYLVELIESAGVTTMHFVPSMLPAFLEHARRERCRSLTRVICSGEALTPELVRRFADALDVPLHNLYGPTECAVDVTYWSCDANSTRGSVPIGRPIANTQIYILDARLQPVPIGVTGELYIGGTGVGRGYWNRPDLTAERFVPDPFKGGRLYRTGDLARFRADGAIEYLGRTDNQVKVRGFRIELGEIESALMECAGVTGAVVIADDTPAGDKRLTAYVSSSTPADTSGDRLAQQLRRSLPDYMVPTAIVTLEALPLLPNGKIDRSRLPRVENRRAHVAPHAGLETEIAAVWEDVLRQAPIGALDDFFELGGNSLSAAQVVARLGQRLDTRIGIKEMFTHPTIRSLAETLSRSDARELPPLTRVPAAADYELSNAERRFWIQEQLSGATGANCQPSAFLVEGPLDIAALRRAFDALIARHDILRTVFVSVDGQPRRRIVGRDQIGFTLGERVLADGADLDASLQAIEREQAASRMDLATGPLFRADLLKISADRHVCICSMHHAITDGWSVGVFQNDLAALYDADIAGAPNPLAPLSIQYQDYAAWHNGILRGAGAKALQEYWQNKLTGAAALSLPRDVDGDAAYQRGVRRFVIPRHIVSTLTSQAHEHNATLFMALVACLKVLLYRHTAESDITIGTPMSTRPLPELEPQIGAYLNILALRDTISRDDTLASVLRAVRTTTLDAYSHQLYPFDRVVEDLELKRVPGRNPLFDVGFTLQNQHEVQASPASRHLRMSEMARDSAVVADAEATTDLWFIARNDDGNLAVQVVYNGARFSAARVDQLSQDLLKIVSAAGVDPDMTVKALPLTTSGGPNAGRTITIDLGF